jgi:hypothetical protein
LENGPEDLADTDFEQAGATAGMVWRFPNAVLKEKSEV